MPRALVPMLCCAFAAQAFAAAGDGTAVTGPNPDQAPAPAPAPAASPGVTTTSAMFSPRLSTREICLNQSVRVEFTSMPAQVKDIDIAASVNAALSTATARELWRVVTPAMVEPRIKNDKVLWITISFKLAPRKGGELALPDVPVQWLEGNQVARFGNVKVAEAMQVGAAQQPLPELITSVGGHRWGTPASALGLGPAIERGGPQRVRAGDTLMLECRGGKLAVAYLAVEDLDLAAARDHLVARWGQPVAETAAGPGQEAMVQWVLGWLRITAKPANTTSGKAGTLVELAHEGIERGLVADKVADDIFGVLNTPQPIVNQPAGATPGTAPQNGGATPKPPGAAAPAAGQPTSEEITREAERRLREGAEERRAAGATQP